MPKPTPNLIGVRFFRVVVIGKAPKDKRNRRMWRCKCDCGNIKIVAANNLNSGHTLSCGCLQIEMRKVSRLTHGYRIGKRITPEYKCWIDIHQRCENPKNPAYERYGGRGISVALKWKEFQNFFEDMGLKPSKKHSIERINNNGNYEASNCKWGTCLEQSNNKCNSRNIYFNGIKRTAAEWARHIGIPVGRIYKRIYRGLSDEMVLIEEFLRIANQVTKPPHDNANAPRSPETHHVRD